MPAIPYNKYNLDLNMRLLIDAAIPYKKYILNCLYIQHPMSVNYGVGLRFCKGMELTFKPSI